mmetsp:Transcript_166262/g.533922  ORF Transcript_166262/g.533922 Transcript_166262/m.533922 type:complete len:305 (-) Transcript_166262:45-959(-)
METTFLKLHQPSQVHRPTQKSSLTDPHVAPQVKHYHMAPRSACGRRCYPFAPRNRLVASYRPRRRTVANSWRRQVEPQPLAPNPARMQRRAVKPVLGGRSVSGEGEANAIGILGRRCCRRRRRKRGRRDLPAKVVENALGDEVDEERQHTQGAQEMQPNDFGACEQRQREAENQDLLPRHESVKDARHHLHVIPNLLSCLGLCRRLPGGNWRQQRERRRCKRPGVFVFGRCIQRKNTCQIIQRAHCLGVGLPLPSTKTFVRTAARRVGLGCLLQKIWAVNQRPEGEPLLEAKQLNRHRSGGAEE